MFMLALFGTIAGLALWLGAVVFLTYFVAPAINRRLTPSKAAEVMEFIAPRYYVLGIVGASLMLIGGVVTLVDPSIRTPAITFMVLTGLALVMSLYAGFVLLPRTDGLRHRLQSSAGSEENFQVRDRYDQAIRLATFFNYLVMFILLGSAAALATLLSPSTPPPG